MAYLTSFLLCLIVAMAAAMPQVVTNMGANDIVYGTSVDEQGSPNQNLQSNRNQLNQQQPFGQPQQFDIDSFLNQQAQQTQQPQQTQQTQQIPAAPGTGTGAARLTSESPTVQACARACITTNEYNPVCGSDTILYNNLRRLDCTNNCGRRLEPNWQEVTILRDGNCSAGGRVA